MASEKEQRVKTLPSSVNSSKKAEQAVNSGVSKRWPIGDGIYLRVRAKGLASWEFRFSLNGKRFTETLGKYGRRPLGIPFGDVKDQTVKIRHELKNGYIAPGSKVRAEAGAFKTVDDLAQRWLLKKGKSLKRVDIIERRYQRWIKPKLGNRPFDRVATIEIEEVLDDIVDCGFKTVANKALSDCKSIFNVAVKQRSIAYNPAQLLDRGDAGGKEKSRKRKLSVEEIETVFKVLRQYRHQFTRENYLAMALLITLGTRKTELLWAKWIEFNFEDNLWHVPQERVKGREASGYDVPLVPVVIEWLKELKIRSAGSQYVFPARRGNAEGHVCENTLNTALQKMFGRGKSNGKHKYLDLFSENGIGHFVIHDLRRTSRSLIRSTSFMGEKRASFEAAERHLNHKLPPLAEIYDPDDFLEERREALLVLSQKLAPFINI